MKTLDATHRNATHRNATHRNATLLGATRLNSAQRNATPPPKLRLVPLAAAGCITAPEPVRSRIGLRDWIAAAAGLLIIAGLTIAALMVVLP